MTCLGANRGRHRQRGGEQDLPLHCFLRFAQRSHCLCRIVVASHVFDKGLLVRLSCSGYVNRAAAKHLGDTVRDLDDLREVVADVDDADAMSGEVAGMIDHPLALHDRERRGWFVQQHHPRLPVNCARDRDRLTLPARETSNRAGICGDVAADLFQQGRGFAAYGAVVDDGKKP